MSKMSDADLQRKEVIEKLKGERIELLEDLKNFDSMGDTEDIKKMEEKIAIVTDQIKTLQALTSDIT